MTRGPSGRSAPARQTCTDRGARLVTAALEMRPERLQQVGLTTGILCLVEFVGDMPWVHLDSGDRHRTGGRHRIGGDMNARYRPIIAVTMVMGMAFAACTNSSGVKDAASSGAVKEGGTLRIGTSSGLISPNPFVGFNQDDYSTWMQIYPSLLQYDTTTPTYEYMPGFASDWEQSEDGLTVTFHTLPDAKWSDGEPLTADDAAWTFNMIKK